MMMMIRVMMMTMMTGKKTVYLYVKVKVRKYLVASKKCSSGLF